MDWLDEVAQPHCPHCPHCSTVLRSIARGFTCDTCRLVFLESMPSPGTPRADP